MKALKEKRISLRSLWRMGLVVLSVFALAFVACGDSDSGEPSGTGPGQGANVSGPVPQAISVATQPIGGSGPTASGSPVHEGQDIVLAGITLNVLDSEGKTTTSSDTSKMHVVPSIYDARYNQYTLYYTDKNTTVSTQLYFNNIRKLITLNVTGQMVKQEYLIDEVPDYTGLTVEGVYSEDSADNALTYPDNTPPNWQTQNKFYRRPINLSVSNPNHRWAWVWNAAPTASAPGDFIPNDNPGVLISIGSYGQIYSKIQGQVPTVVGADILKGTRIEITRLYQVRTIEVTGTWGDIFYDDPTLIGAVQSDEQLQLRMANWIDKLGNANVKVTYTNGVDRNYDFRTLQSMEYVYGDSLRNEGYGATWATLEIFPVSRAGKRIDVTKDNKAIVSAQDESSPGVGDAITVDHFTWLEKDNDNYVPYQGESQVGGGRTIIGDGGWAQWAQLGAAYTRLGFWWRGIGADLNATGTAVVVPIYNRPISMTVSPKGNEPFSPVRMVGFDQVHRQPEGMKDFLNKVTIAVTYQRQGTTDTKPRNDLVGDIARGVCRAWMVAPWSPDNDASATDPGSAGYIGEYVSTFYSDKGAAMTLHQPYLRPTLYAEAIWNFKDLAPNPSALDAWNYDANALLAVNKAENKGWTVTSTTAQPELEQLSFLTKDNSEQFESRGRTVRGRITYTGWAGNPDNARPVNSGAVPLVAPIGYLFNPTPSTGTP